ncbi:hypothetical protein Y032_0077g1103 [Ancylostoma ceylanicum]|uniref:Endonuclease/exonuclease/phosphatase domain-containing protein n=1 Tax=Ancylostoma ceylanicum TaxID=53326 RepID=A0A016TTW5_9BILA|nr:hypothetical protein Y032_0077g1103 [Ancylostoma ceylanicum]
MVTGYLRVIQVYAPTTAHTDDEYYEFLDHITEALNTRSSASPRKKCTKIVIGDFNAKIGCGNAEEQYIGPYGLGVRNRRGNILAHFCCETHLHVMNNRFQKRSSRKWTWISPNMKTKNAIDFVLSEDPAIFLDIDIIGRFRFTSDHRLVMAKIRLRNRRFMFKKKPRSTLNKEAFSSALEYLASSTDLSNYEQLKRAIALAADGASAKQVKESHISEGTRKLYECRHRLLHQLSARSTVEFPVVSKALRESLKADIERKHLSRIHQAISSGRSIRKALQTNKTYTRPLKQLKRNDGTIARTSADVEAVVQDFVNNLFSSTTPSLPQVLQGCEDLPPILPREVRNALSKMKVGKAPGPDNITVEMLIKMYARIFENFENTGKPKECELIGSIPPWLKGTIVRNGPGMFKIGDTEYKHWWDGLAYIQRYHFVDGKPVAGAKSSHSFEGTEVLGVVPATDPRAPCYFHSFGLTQNYFVLFESPQRTNVMKLCFRKFRGISFNDCMYWDEKAITNVIVFDRTKRTKVERKITADPFFVFHHANAYEKDGYLFVDYCKVFHTDNMNELLLEHLRSGAFREKGSSLVPFLYRMIVPMNVKASSKPGDDLLATCSFSGGCRAILKKDGSIHCTDSQMSDVSMEFPIYRCDRNSMEYRYVYGSCFVDPDNTREGVVKTDLKNVSSTVWNKDAVDQIAAEPVFVCKPGAAREDEGVLVVPVVTSRAGHQPYVVVLDAETMVEMGRFLISQERIPLGFHAQYNPRSSS